MELLSGRSDDVHLDRAALELATIKYPGLDIANSIAILDSYAAELRSRLAGSDPARGEHDELPFAILTSSTNWALRATPMTTTTRAIVV